MYFRSRLLYAAATCVLSGGCAFADTFSIPGTGDGIEIFQELARSFVQQGATATIEIPASIGSGGGIAAVSDGRASLGRIARPLSAAETEAGLSATPIMKIPSAIFVHPMVGVDNLTYAQLAGIYSGAFADWSEVGGTPMRIRVVRRDSEDSTLKVLRATMPGWKDIVVTPRSKIAVTTQEAVRTVRETEGAIGFGPLSATIDAGVRVVKIEHLDPSVANYPSFVTVSLIYRAETLSQAAASFVAFAQSEIAQAAVRKLGALPVAN